MRKRAFTEGMFLGAGATALTGMGMVLSVILAGPGIVLLTVASVLLLAGLVVELVVPALPRETSQAEGQPQPTRR